MWNKVFKHQSIALILLILLLSLLYVYTCTHPKIIDGELWSISTTTWFLFAIALPIIHQLYVLICWRLELHFKSISNHFGANGFNFFKIGFAILILLRPVSIIFLAISNNNTLEISNTFSYLISLLLLIPSIYLFYSVIKYFGMDRAFGIDHFKPETVGKESFVKRGIFKHTSNGMYVYGFLILWIPGFLFQSEAALATALFNHIYIWVHYYFTELPDIKIIYRKTN